MAVLKLDVTIGETVAEFEFAYAYANTSLPQLPSIGTGKSNGVARSKIAFQGFQVDRRTASLMVLSITNAFGDIQEPALPAKRLGTYKSSHILHIQDDRLASRIRVAEVFLRCLSYASSPDQLNDLLRTATYPEK